MVGLVADLFHSSLHLVDPVYYSILPFISQFYFLVRRSASVSVIFLSLFALVSSLVSSLVSYVVSRSE